MLGVYRIGVFITTPGVDRNALRLSMASKSSGFWGLFNLFSGGALEKASLFSLGIMPYVSASIVIQLLSIVYKPIEELRKEGEAGRRKIEQYTRYGALVLALFQAWVIATQQLESAVSDAGDVVIHPGVFFRVMTVITLTTGTAFLMWIGEQITERGVSNGISILIFAGIVADVPSSIAGYLLQNKDNFQPLAAMAIVGIVLSTVATIVFFERAQRRIPIVYSRRQVGSRTYGGHQPHLPLRVNSAGTIPPIFASSLLVFPATLASLGVWGMRQVEFFINRGDWIFNICYVCLIVFFCFFYTSIVFPANDLADNLKKQQANIPGIRPGRQTADYIDGVLSKITLAGALYVAAVCVIPVLLAQAFRVPFRFGGTSLMIIVGVALDIVNQIQSHLISGSYDDVLTSKFSTLRARRSLDQEGARLCVLY